MTTKKICDECGAVVRFGHGMRLHRIESFTGEMETPEAAVDFCGAVCLQEWTAAEYPPVPPAATSIAKARQALAGVKT